VAGASPTVHALIWRLPGVYRSQEDNVRALNTLRRSFPDYSQMKPEEMTREQWDVFYPLAYWDIIVQESRARNLDPFSGGRTDFARNSLQFSRPLARQCLWPDAGVGAHRQTDGEKYGVDRTITSESLYDRA